MNPSSVRQELGTAAGGLAPIGHPALAHLVESLQDRYGNCVAAVLFYGSCLRSGNPYDGLVDLYLIVDHYRCANSSLARTLWNRVLPPNVFYTEIAHEEHTLRCKYAVLSLADLEKGTSQRWFHSYLWGRFSQPTAIAYCRDNDTRKAIESSLAQSVLTFLNRVLPSLPARGTVQSLWRNGLRLSYRAELRAESPGRSVELAEINKAYYQRITRLAASELGYPCELSGSEPDLDYQVRIPKLKRYRNRLGWTLRILQGKFLSIARLLKALFTFDGGLDYIAWKLERHSGVPVTIPDKVRRYPLIFIWGLFWDLYRRGVFR